MTVNYPALINHSGKYPLFVCKAADPREDSTGHYRIWKPGWSGLIGGQNIRCPVLFDAVCDVTTDVPNLTGARSPCVNPWRVTRTGNAQRDDGA